MNTFKSANIENVKVGDLIIVCGNYVETVEKVVEVLKTSYKTDSGKKFNKYGYTPGSDWGGHVAYLYEKEWADKIIYQNKKDKAVSWLKKIKWENFSNAALDEICKLVKSEEDKLL